MRRHDRRPRRRPTPLRTRPPCGRRSKPTTPTRLPPLRRTAPSPAGASQQSQACIGSSLACTVSTPTSRAGTRPASPTWSPCLRCAPHRPTLTPHRRCLPARCLHRCRLPTPSRPPARMSPLLPMLPSFTRQMADAFNQPLSFDTSSVTSMQRMFEVRSARARPSASTVGPLPARCLHRQRFYTPSRLPARMSPSSHASLLLRRARTGCPTRTSSSSVVRGRAVTRLSASTMWSGAIWARARRRHRCRRCRRRRRPTLLMRRHDRRPRRRRPTPLRTRPPCGRRSPPTTPTRLPPLRRTAPSPAGTSQQSRA